MGRVRRGDERTSEFFSKVGFEFDAVFTDENATRMIISDETSCRPRAGSRSTRGSGIEAGGQALGESQDEGVMYMRGFHDLDGHQWSFIYMDMSAIPEG